MGIHNFNFSITYVPVFNSSDNKKCRENYASSGIYHLAKKIICNLVKQVRFAQLIEVLAILFV